MAIMIGCGVLLALGLLGGWRWRSVSFATPGRDVDLTSGEVARRYAWYVAIALTGGVAAGVTVIGAGGRLAMRLLAVTAGASAQGRLTEADEIVGTISLGGTLGFVIFNGVFGGVVFGALYLVVRRFLPAGPLGGVAYGLGLLVVFGTVLDPLRRQNPDFDIVGPGWVAVVTFTLLALAFGVVLHGLTARMSTWLPLLSSERRVLVRYIAPAALAAVGFSVTAFLVLVGAVAVLATRLSAVVDIVRSPGWIIAGRVVLIGAVLLSVPNVLGSIADITTR